MPNRSQEVDRFMSELDHPSKWGRASEDGYPCRNVRTRPLSGSSTPQRHSRRVARLHRYTPESAAYRLQF